MKRGQTLVEQGDDAIKVMLLALMRWHFPISTVASPPALNKETLIPFHTFIWQQPVLN